MFAKLLNNPQLFISLKVLFHYMECTWQSHSEFVNIKFNKSNINKNNIFCHGKRLTI